MFLKEFKSRLERSSRTTFLEFQRKVTGQASHKSVQPSGEERWTQGREKAIAIKLWSKKQAGPVC